MKNYRVILLVEVTAENEEDAKGQVDDLLTYYAVPDFIVLDSVVENEG